jgi:tRNA 2-(methylsulfanyl)-N6-isopentenyladenosine37 hydroxylase
MADRDGSPIGGDRVALRVADIPRSDDGAGITHNDHARVSHVVGEIIDHSYTERLKRLVVELANEILTGQCPNYTARSLQPYSDRTRSGYYVTRRTMTRRHDDLPLRYGTPDRWAAAVLRAPLDLLNDHAHLEKKAATNALELLNRFPEPNPPENWVAAMTAIARDEVEHLAVVSRLLARRGGRLTRQHRNDYASRLRELVRMGTGPGELVDRLMISALIEARSCERFRLLASACEPSTSSGSVSSTSWGQGDMELAKLYRGLWASEHGHYRTFIQLAEQIQPDDLVAKRWDEMLDAEAQIIARQPPGPRMHSGVL